MQSIVDHKQELNGQHVFNVRWQGCPPSEDTWQSESSLEQCQVALNKYENSLKRKSRSSSRVVQQLLVSDGTAADAEEQHVTLSHGRKRRKC